MIVGLFYSEFDNKSGPTIRYQYPEFALDPEIFDDLADFIIVSPNLCRKTITIHANENIIMSYPLHFKDEKFERNTLSCAFGIVFQSESESFKRKLEASIKNIGRLIESIEVEHEMIYSQKFLEKLTVILPVIFRGLSKDEKLIFQLSDSALLSENSCLSQPSYSELKQYNVPIRLLSDLSLPVNVSKNVALMEILSMIDGIKPVRQISRLSVCDDVIVQSSLNILVKLGIIGIIDIFRYRNTYEVNSEYSYLISNYKFLSSCSQFISRKGRMEPPYSIIRKAYFSLCKGKSLSEVILQDCQLSDLCLTIDFQKLICFGMLNKVIVRVHEYPFCPSVASRQLIVRTRIAEPKLKSKSSIIISQSALSFNQLFTTMNPAPIARQPSATLSVTTGTPNSSTDVRSHFSIGNKKKIHSKTSMIISNAKIEPIIEKQLSRYEMKDSVKLSMDDNENEVSNTLEELPSNLPSFRSLESHDTTYLTRRLVCMMDGNHCLDEICCEALCSFKELMNHVEREAIQGIVWIHFK